MNHLKRIMAASTLLALLVVTAAMPVAAQQGSGEPSDAKTAAAEREQLREDRQKVAEDKQQAKQDRQDVSQAEHEKRCEAHKQGLGTRADAIVTNAQRAQDRISQVLAKAVAYQNANNVTVANWDSLLTAANSAKADSAAAIANLGTVKPSLDCNSTSVKSDVTAFKTAAQDTRDKLKAYRGAVKAVVQALIAAKAGGQQ